MRANITENTCVYGLARTDVGCVRTLASLDPEAYVQTQLLYLVLGFLLAAATGFLYWRANRNDCARLQQRSLLLSFFGGLTFVVRGVDPSGYKHLLPRPVAHMLANACTAAIFTIYIMSLVYWASIIQQGAAQLERPLKIRCLQYSFVSLIWTFYTILSASSFLSKGFLTAEMTFAQMAGGVGFLTLVSTAFLVYGLRVMSRLRAFERLQKQHQQIQRILTQTCMDPGTGESPTSADNACHGKTVYVEAGDCSSGDCEGSRVAPKKKSHAARIRKILLVVESISLLVIGAQVYVGVSRSNKSAVELDCANGFNCDHVHCSMHVLHWFQVACICVVVWVFRNTQKREQPTASDQA